MGDAGNEVRGRKASTITARARVTSNGHSTYNLCRHRRPPDETPPGESLIYSWPCAGSAGPTALAPGWGRQEERNQRMNFPWLTRTGLVACLALSPLALADVPPAMERVPTDAAVVVSMKNIG